MSNESELKEKVEIAKKALLDLRDGIFFDVKAIDALINKTLKELE